MLKEMKETWTQLDQNILVNKRELVLGIAVSALAGVVVGLLLSPQTNRTLTFGPFVGRQDAAPADTEQDAAPADAEQEFEEA